MSEIIRISDSPLWQSEEIRTLGKVEVAYGRQEALWGKKEADSVLYFWMKGYITAQSLNETRIQELNAKLSERRNLLEDVVNELDLSEAMIEKHGPMGTAPAKLVRIVLDEKDMKMSMLKSGMIELKGGANGKS